MKNTTLFGNMPKRSFLARIPDQTRKRFIDVIAALFILIYLYTAISKSSNINYTVATLNSSTTFKPIAREIAWIVVYLEYLIVLLLFFPKTKRIGFFASFGSMTLFTLYIIYMMIFVPNLPCSCGGIISRLNWPQHLTLNIFLTLLALLGIGLTKKEPIESDDMQSNRIVFT